MSHAINVPDELFAQIEDVARRKGSKPDTIVQQWLRAAILQSNEVARDQEYDPSRDPLMRLAGIISSGDPSWGDHHDEHLAEAHQDSHESE